MKPDIVGPDCSKIFTVKPDIVHYDLHVKPDIVTTVKPDIVGVVSLCHTKDFLVHARDMFFMFYMLKQQAGKKVILKIREAKNSERYVVVAFPIF